MLLCGTKQCLGRFLLAVGYLLHFSLKQAYGQMGGRYLGAPNCLTNCEVSSARGELGFEPVCHVELLWGCLLARLLVNYLDLRNTLYSSKLLTLFSFHLTSRSLDFSLLQKTLCFSWMVPGSHSFGLGF